MGSGVKTITLLEAQKEGLSVNSLWKEAEGLSIGVLGIIFLLQIGAYSSLCFVLHWLSNQQILRKVASAAKTIRARVGRSWVNNSHSQHSDTQMELTGPKNESSQTEMQSKFDINIQGNIYFQQVSAEKEGKQSITIQGIGKEFHVVKFILLTKLYHLLLQSLRNACCRPKTSTSVPDCSSSTSTASVQGKDNVEPNKDLLSSSWVFSKSVSRVVDDVSLDLYQDEVFVLLGHNGAGKTTLIKMLTGELIPDQGEATFFQKYLLSRDFSTIRNSIGICPQKDLLYDDLSVREHLDFYAALKGLSGGKADAQIINILQTIGLGPDGDDKVNVLAKNLSGGQKRKLSVGISLLGDSALIFLDEPSSGMDVASQRSLWDLIEKVKHGRTVILTTHYVEEIEAIGDRVAILSHGTVQCCGTKIFLKNLYAPGYSLNISFSSRPQAIRKELPSLEYVPPSLGLGDDGDFKKLSSMADLLHATPDSALEDEDVSTSDQKEIEHGEVRESHSVIHDDEEKSEAIVLTLDPEAADLMMSPSCIRNDLQQGMGSLSSVIPHKQEEIVVLDGSVCETTKQRFSFEPEIEISKKISSVQSREEAEEKEKEEGHEAKRTTSLRPEEYLSFFEMFAKYFPRVELTSSSGGEASFQVPQYCQEDLLDIVHALSSEKVRWGIKSYAISTSSLTQVFLNAGIHAQAQAQARANTQAHTQAYAPAQIESGLEQESGKISISMIENKEPRSQISPDHLVEYRYQPPRLDLSEPQHDHNHDHDLWDTRQLFSVEAPFSPSLSSSLSRSHPVPGLGGSTSIPQDHEESAVEPPRPSLPPLPKRPAGFLKTNLTIGPHIQEMSREKPQKPEKPEKSAQTEKSLQLKLQPFAKEYLSQVDESPRIRTSEWVCITPRSVVSSQSCTISRDKDGGGAAGIDESFGISMEQLILHQKVAGLLKKLDALGDVSQARQYLSSAAVFRRQFYGIIKVRARTLRHQPKAILWLFIYPALVLLITLLVVSRGPPENPPTLALSMDLFPPGLADTVIVRSGTLSQRPSDPLYGVTRESIVSHGMPQNANMIPWSYNDQSTSSYASVWPAQSYLARTVYARDRICLLALNINHMEMYPALGQDWFNAATKEPRSDSVLPRNTLNTSVLGSLHFNTTSPHSLPIAYSSFSNALLRASSEENAGKSITTSSKPFPKSLSVGGGGEIRDYSLEALGSTTSSDSIQSVAVVFSLSLAFSFGPAIFGSTVTKERVDRIKHLMLTSGLWMKAYWASTIFWDAVCYVVFCVCVIFLVKVFQLPVISTSSSAYVAMEDPSTGAMMHPNLGMDGGFGVFCVGLLCFGYAMIPLSYLLSRAFQSAYTSQITILLINITTGGAMLVAVLVTRIIKVTQPTARNLVVILRVFPSFSLGEIFLNILTAKNPMMTPLFPNEGQEDWDIKPAETFYDLRLAGSCIIYMLVMGTLFWLCFLLSEYRERYFHGVSIPALFSRCCCRKKLFSSDPDVKGHGLGRLSPKPKKSPPTPFSQPVDWMSALEISSTPSKAMMQESASSASSASSVPSASLSPPGDLPSLVESAEHEEMTESRNDMTSDVKITRPIKQITQLRSPETRLGFETQGHAFRVKQSYIEKVRRSKPKSMCETVYEEDVDENSNNRDSVSLPSPAVPTVPTATATNAKDSVVYDVDELICDTNYSEGRLHLTNHPIEAERAHIQQVVPHFTKKGLHGGRLQQTSNVGSEEAKNYFIVVDRLQKIYHVSLADVFISAIKKIFQSCCKRNNSDGDLSTTENSQGNDTGDQYHSKNSENIENSKSTTSTIDPATGGHIAVRDISFSVRKGECFGFLGANGAGKTTTLKILTGEVQPSNGAIYLKGKNIASRSQGSSLLDDQTPIGYCPQIEAFHQQLTGRENLDLFADIRCLSKDHVEEYISILLNLFELDHLSERPSEKYSGGNQRKLSLAIALLSGPPILVLDEPSTGMDIATRRLIWSILSHQMKDKATILTTHSMEECESLCDKIGIMTQGEIRCIGSSASLKENYSHAFQINLTWTDCDRSKVEKNGEECETTAKKEGEGEGIRPNVVDEDDRFVLKADTVDIFMQSILPGSKRLEIHGNSVEYLVPRSITKRSRFSTKIETVPISISSLFSIFEQCKKQTNIETFAVSSVSLDQVFVEIVRLFADEQKHRTN